MKRRYFVLNRTYMSHKGKHNRQVFPPCIFNSRCWWMNEITLNQPLLCALQLGWTCLLSVNRRCGEKCTLGYYPQQTLTMPWFGKCVTLVVWQIPLRVDFCLGKISLSLYFPLWFSCEKILLTISVAKRGLYWNSKEIAMKGHNEITRFRPQWLHIICMALCKEFCLDVTLKNPGFLMQVSTSFWQIRVYDCPHFFVGVLVQ